MRSEAINAALERTISRARLGKYLRATKSDLDAAIELYERNTSLSEALYTTLQGLEICLRNTIDLRMIEAYGSDWFLNGAAPLQPNAHQAIDHAMAELRHATHDSLVAELKFSFWVGLLGVRYDQSLWRTTLHKGFRAKSGKKRSDVHGRMNALRRFRNRVAHHEPILDTALQMHTEALEAIEWMCRDTHAWVASRSQFTTVYHT